jgi:hypothetical protein
VDNHFDGPGSLATLCAMTTPRPPGQQLRKNTNDIEALYELSVATNHAVATVEIVQQRHGNRLGIIGHTLDVHTARLNRISSRLNHIETTQHHHTETLNAHSEILKAHSKTLDEHTTKLDAIGGRLDAMGGRLDTMGGRLDTHDSKLDKIIQLLGAR